MKAQNKFPPGWDEERAERALTHYQEQTEDEAVAEDEAAFGESRQTILPGTSAAEILEAAQYVVDEQGRQTAVILPISVWQALQELLTELAEDERLGELMTAVQHDEKLTPEAAKQAYYAI